MYHQQFPCYTSGMMNIFDLSTDDDTSCVTEASHVQLCYKEFLVINLS
jgi:hypothetical protein